MPRWEQLWPEFEATMKERLAAGYQHYGDWSFDRPASNLLEEVEQELYDTIGWSFILIDRLRRLQCRLKELEHVVQENEESPQAEP